MAKLTSKGRASLPASDFAIPSKREYPIEDASHERAALQRVSEFGTPEVKALVRAAVHRKYPSIK